jgi:putative mycofactocin binding protein MftB
LDPDARRQLHQQVELHPEPFGALLYHFGTHQPSYVKALAILADSDVVVRST